MVLWAAPAFSSCLPPGPEDEPAPDMALFVRWTINGSQPDETLCKSLSPGTVSVELWEDSDCDGNTSSGDGFYIYRFDCDGGVCVNPERAQIHGSECKSDSDCGGPPGYCLRTAGKTAKYFFSGTPSCVKLVLNVHLEDVDPQPSPISWLANFQNNVCNRYCDSGFCYEDYESCQDDCYCDVKMGSTADKPECVIDETNSFSACVDLGTIDFDLSSMDFGPLDVQLSWQWESGETPFGTCEEANVTAMGYTIEKRYVDDETGEPFFRTLDELSIERREPCMDSLQWALVPFGSYRLSVEGRNETGSMMWHTVCLSEDGGNVLTVDSADQNSYLCEVSRL